MSPVEVKSMDSGARLLGLTPGPAAYLLLDLGQVNFSVLCHLHVDMIIVSTKEDSFQR